MPEGPGPLISPGVSWSNLQQNFVWQVPELLNIAALCCDRWALQLPDHPAVIHIDADGRRAEMNFAQLKERSDRLATAFLSLGIRRGDRVAILLPQHPDVLLTHFAAWKIGAITLPLFTLFGEDALRYRLADSGAKAIVTDAEQVPQIIALRCDLPQLSHVISTGAAKLPVASLSQLIGASKPIAAPVVTGADDAATMIYTSGTTGHPKGVLHGHRFLLGHLPGIELAYGALAQGGGLGWTPADWAWIGGLMDLAMPSLYFGQPVLSHRAAKFDPEAALYLMREEGVTDAFIPPTALRLMKAAPKSGGLNLRGVISGGEPLGADLLDWGQSQLGCSISEIYGQTEANLLVVARSGMMERREGAMGLPVPGHRLRIALPDGRDVGEGDTGEIWVKLPDPVAMLRYWNKPDATERKTKDGWLRTGDLAQLGKDGQLVFASRDDDVITSAGYRIGPAEIEAALARHPEVLMAAVVGEPDPIRTEIVVAYIVPADDVDWNALIADLPEWVRQKVAGHLVPRKFYRRESLPMTATGKIMRRSLRSA